jgi:hypothetical protein
LQPAATECGHAASAEPAKAEPGLWVRITYKVAASATPSGVAPAAALSAHGSHATAFDACPASRGAVTASSAGACSVSALPVPVWQLQRNTQAMGDLRLLWPASLTDAEAPDGRGWRVLQASFQQPLHGTAFGTPPALATSVAARDDVWRSECDTEPSTEAGPLKLEALCVAVCIRTSLCDAAQTSVAAATARSCIAGPEQDPTAVPTAASSAIPTPPVSAAPSLAVAATALAIGRFECWRGGATFSPTGS